ncbi:peptidoglycan editing factor PgeF [Streptomyces cocklensis]|uniref:Purine nucleoside phosphorylase n=1 Tax=Actinacidiphila cocklensis TaxID=887465 RepID=A0A9W4GU62_9ACTN|nr:peptidoglycan editing factor PgeF [Actinacidiphila cocklensis]MDD1060421.1 peptidoglycan editing factor PgeF [Actinacidiphila cocklensis]CAG6395390.1 Purine nucleoside phosphorylase [Actinacidiphila cocklensis]
MIGNRTSANGAHFAFTDRWGGVSAVPYDSLNLGGAVGDDPAAVRANRDLAARALGRDPGGVVWMNQVHGREVAVVHEPWGAGPAPDVDALVTTGTDLTLGVLTADCVPVLLADPVAGVVAAAHAGRPGMTAGIATAVIEMMITLGADPDRTTAVLGPAVCGKCYEVPASLRDEVAAVEAAAYAETSWGTPAVDVAAGVRAQLTRAGVRSIEGPAACTLESADHFSYRRDRVTGRLAGYVWLDGDR